MERRILAPKKIRELSEGRQKKFQGRNTQYATFLDYYFGRHQDSRQNVKAMDSKGRPLLRYLGASWEDLGARKVVSNRVQPIVDDYQALVGRVPKTRVDPPDDTPPAQDKAELLTKYLVSTYELSEMTFQQADAAFFISCLGDGCYVLEVEVGKRRVVIASVNPMNAFPSFRGGYARSELYDLILSSVEDPDTIEQEHGVRPKSSDRDDCTVTTYMNPWQRSVLVGEQLINHVEHNLGWCPARWHHNKYVNGEMATSDISQILAWQDYYNFALNVSADGLVEMTYPIRHLINPVAFGDDQLEIGPGSTVVSDETGKIELHNPTPPPQAALKLMELGANEMMMGAGTTPVRMEGDMHSSIQTGRAIQSIQGPQATRIDMKQVALSFTFTRLNAMAMEMQEKAPFLKDKTFEIYGRLKGKDFRQEMSSSDIDGWYQNTVTWDGMIGVSEQQRVVIGMQGMASKIWDDIEAREKAGVDDPVGMRDRITAQAKWEANLQQQLQQIAQPAQPGMTGFSPSQTPNAPPGAPSGPPPPPMIFRPPEQVPPPNPRGLPQGVTLTAIQTALQPLQGSLQGEVYAVADLARMGQSTKPQFILTNFKDYQKVKQALDAIIPGGYSLKAVSNPEAIGDMKVKVA